MKLLRPGKAGIDETCIERGRCVFDDQGARDRAYHVLCCDELLLLVLLVMLLLRSRRSDGQALSSAGRGKVKLQLVQIWKEQIQV